jgi:hypothetical protein
VNCGADHLPIERGSTMAPRPLFKPNKLAADERPGTSPVRQKRLPSPRLATRVVPNMLICRYFMESPLPDSNRRPPLYEEGPCVKRCVVSPSHGGRCCGGGWGAGLISLSPPRGGGQGRLEFAPVAHLLKDGQAARGSVAPLGANASPRLSMCQIASDSRRARSTWATLPPRCLPIRALVCW